MKKNKVVILFLIKFFVVYFSLTGFYNLYLNSTQKSNGVFTCAPVTKTVTNHAKFVCEKLGYQIDSEQNKNELSISFYVNKDPVAKIIEGCTSISIMILFLAFIVAFSGTLKVTIVYGVIGLFLIYAANIFRIVLLALAIYHYPEHQKILHDIVFPAIIYGMVFLLWIVWVNKYAKLKSN